jgi:hypothetical protein
MHQKVTQSALAAKRLCSQRSPRIKLNSKRVRDSRSKRELVLSKDFYIILSLASRCDCARCQHRRFYYGVAVDLIAMKYVRVERGAEDVMSKLMFG